MSQNSKFLYLNFLKKAGISFFLQNKPNIFYNTQPEEKDNFTNTDISKVKSLEELRLLVKEKNLFKSKKYPNKYIIGEGDEKSKILIIGEFPEEENQKIKTFAGESEKILDKMLKAIKLSKNKIYISNVIYWLNNENKKIENKDILECLPFVQKQIEIINPKIILLMGHVAAKAILNSNLEINQLRGKWHNYRSINMNQTIECLVTFNPKHLIEFSNDKKYAWDDLQIFEKK